MKNRIILIIVILIVVIQFVPVKRNNPPVTADLVAPAEVKTVIKTSCYDCHSNETVWPWYSYVAPVSWLVAHDVEEGREHINFSEWQNLTSEQQDRIKHHVVGAVEKGFMPLPIYTKMHRQAVVDSSELKILKSWIE